MAMSIFEQLEHCKDVFVEQSQAIKKTKENKIYNENYINLVNTFNKELYQYFTEFKSDENILTQCTQQVWYSLYLERKRLERLGLRKMYKGVHQLKNDSELISIKYKDDGKNTICEIVDKNNSSGSFYYENSKNEKSNIFYGKNMREYIITSSKFRTLSECACLNCGAFMSVEKLIDGCDYCRTKYTLQDLQGKVSSLYEKNNYTKSRRGAPIILVLFSVICFIIKLIPIGVIFILIAMLYVALNGEKTTKSISKLKKRFNLFSEEALFSEIENKLFSIHYCDNEKELESLCDCKLNVDYKNVLLCETDKYFIDDVTTTKDGNYLLMSCRFYLKVTYFSNNKIMNSDELVKFKMIRSVSSLNSIKQDLINYKCKDCGASLSLLNGGVCKYCGNKINLENFDWKVIEYKSNWKIK